MADTSSGVGKGKGRVWPHLWQLVKHVTATFEMLMWDGDGEQRPSPVFDPETTPQIYIPQTPPLLTPIWRLKAHAVCICCGVPGTVSMPTGRWMINSDKTAGQNWSSLTPPSCYKLSEMRVRETTMIQVQGRVDWTSTLGFYMFKQCNHFLINCYLIMNPPPPALWSFFFCEDICNSCVIFFLPLFFTSISHIKKGHFCHFGLFSLTF